MHPAARLISVVLLSIAAGASGGCEGEDYVFEPDDWEVVWTAPGEAVFRATSSPDGSIFLSMFNGNLYRSDPDNPYDFELIGSAADASGYAAVFWGMFAPSSSTLFGVGGPSVWRWEEGVGVHRAVVPISSEYFDCGDFFPTEDLMGVWGRSATDLYAVGSHGLILHFDGVDWTFEENRLRDASPSPCWQSFDTELRGVGGDDQRVLAAGMHTIVELTDTGWAIIERPSGDEGRGMLTTVVGHDGDVLVAGGWFHRLNDEPPYQFAEPARMFRRRGEEWILQNREARSAGTIHGGTGHPGAKAVFWSFFERVVLVDGGAITTYAVPGLALRGAEIVDGRVYVIGNGSAGTVVARLPI